MGYVEVGGNGSVVWHAQHDQGVGAACHPGGAWGKDANPPRFGGGRFTIIINGEAPRTVDLDTSRIVILWGTHHADNVPPDNRVGDIPMDEQRVRERFERLPQPKPPEQP